MALHSRRGPDPPHFPIPPCSSTSSSLFLSSSLSLTKNPISGQSGGISLRILQQPGITSPSRARTHTEHTHEGERRREDIQAYRGTRRRTKLSGRTFISSRQLAVEYMTRLRRELQSWRDAATQPHKRTGPLHPVSKDGRRDGASFNCCCNHTHTPYTHRQCEGLF